MRSVFLSITHLPQEPNNDEDFQKTKGSWGKENSRAVFGQGEHFLSVGKNYFEDSGLWNSERSLPFSGYLPQKEGLAARVWQRMRHPKTKLRWLVPLVCVGAVMGMYEVLRARKPRPSVYVQLHVRVQQRQVLALLMFCNQSQKRVYIDQSKAFLRFNPAEPSEGSLFDPTAALEVVTSGVRLNWSSEKRSSVLTRTSASTSHQNLQSRFTVLLPGQIATTVVDLSRGYEFLKGLHEYAVTYDAFHEGPNAQSVHLLSNTVRFLYASPEE